jgi:hypothetical protein
MESQLCVVEDANKNANILHWVWLDGMFQAVSVNKGYKQRNVRRDYLPEPGKYLRKNVP